jgi:hypothetical protein
MHPGRVLTGLATEAFPQVRSIALAETSIDYVVKVVQGVHKSAES